MAVGAQPTEASINQQLTNYAQQLRNILQAVANLSTEVNANNTGQANLVAMGFSVADATSALNFIGYMNTVAGAYFGTVQQGGTGGTGAILFNFHQALAPLWAGQ